VLAEQMGREIEILAGQLGTDFSPAPVPDIYRERLLTLAERELARKVFAGSLPLAGVWLSNRTGSADRQYVVAHPARPGSWVIHGGATMDADATQPAVDEVLMHELTHVWQSAHGPNTTDYLARWLHEWATVGDQQAYNCQPGQPWASYGVEQQASIVADWYSGGMNEADALFPYIRDTVRQGRTA
jgi:hypothetical protein